MKHTKPNTNEKLLLEFETLIYGALDKLGHVNYMYQPEIRHLKLSGCKYIAGNSDNIISAFNAESTSTFSHVCLRAIKEDVVSELKKQKPEWDWVNQLV